MNLSPGFWALQNKITVTFRRSALVLRPGFGYETQYRIKYKGHSFETRLIPVAGSAVRNELLGMFHP
jgi:hypothetical protein